MRDPTSPSPRTLRPALHVVGFELRRRLHGPRYRIAILIMALASLGLGLAIRPDWLSFRGAASLYHYVYLVALALVYRFDLSHDIDRGFADFMAPNLVPPGRYIALRLLAGLAALIQFAILTAVLTALAPRFDFRFALWMGAFWILLATLFAPAIALAELWLGTLLPVLAVTALVMVTLIVGATTGSLAMFEILGLEQTVFGAYRSLDGLALRAAVLGVGGLTLAYPLLRRHWTARS